MCMSDDVVSDCCVMTLNMQCVLLLLLVIVVVFDDDGAHD